MGCLNGKVKLGHGRTAGVLPYCLACKRLRLDIQWHDDSTPIDSFQT